MPCTNTIGANTHTVVSVEDVIAAPTSLAPATAAFFGGTPARRRRKIFSMTTIELSTSMPTATASPERDIMLIVIPEKYISTIANVILIGMLKSVMNVGLISRRKSSRMITANSAPYARLSRIEWMIR